MKGTRRDMTKPTESDLAREKIQFLAEGHPSSNEDVDMEGEGEEDEPMSSEPQERSHPPMEEPEFHPRDELNKCNYTVDLAQMADVAEGGELQS